MAAKELIKKLLLLSACDVEAPLDGTTWNNMCMLHCYAQGQSLQYHSLIPQ